MTITIPRRVPFLPFLNVPAAAITFNGIGEVLDLEDVPQKANARLFRGLDLDRDLIEATRMIRVTPIGEFVTFGIAMPLLKMRKVEQAQGRALCGTTAEAAAARR